MFQTVLFLIGMIIDNFKDLNRFTAVSISFIYLLTALYIWLEKKNNYNRFVSIAVVFCFTGDMLLSKFIPGGTMIGMGAFAIAHILFIIAYVNTIHDNNGKVMNFGFCVATIVYYLYFLILWNIFLRNTPSGELFSFASLIYGLIVGTMASVAVSLYINGEKYIKTALGAFIFLLSDSLIAVTQTTIVSNSEIIIWITYVLALYGIIYSNNFT